MKLRKGRLYEPTTGQSTKILSMSFTDSTDTDGVGNKGMGTVINSEGRLVINIQFSDLTREIMVGTP
jgi:hypothetical protein